MAGTRFKRRIKLIKTHLQLKVVYYMFLVALIIIAFHSWFLSHLFHKAQQAEGTVSGLNFSSLILIDLGITLILTIAFVPVVGILNTHRFAGPIYRFEKAFKNMAKGNIGDRIVLRKGDMLLETCEELNYALANLREHVENDRKLIEEISKELLELEELAKGEEEKEKIEIIATKLKKVTSRFVLESPKDAQKTQQSIEQNVT
jgi:hypothetical protein